MRLKEFMERYGDFSNDDLQLLIMWAIKYDKEPELIGVLNKLAKSVADKNKAYKTKVREWTYYAYSTAMLPISADTSFSVCINKVRMADLAFTQDDIFVKAIDEILESKEMKLDYIKEMHRDIYERYIAAKERFKDGERERD